MLKSKIIAIVSIKKKIYIKILNVIYTILLVTKRT